MIIGPMDKLKSVRPGDVISAEQWTIMQALLRQKMSAPNAFVTGTGVFTREKLAASSAISWCVVWLPLTADDSIVSTVFVKTVDYNQGEDTYAITGEPVEVQCYPGHVRRDFFTLATDEVGNTTQDTQICKLIRVSNVWHCEPFSRRARRKIDALDRIRLSDCEPQVE